MWRTKRQRLRGVREGYRSGLGRFLAKDRTKHLLIQKQYPELDLRFVFTNSRQKLYKGSKTTYAAWCEKHGFLYAERSIPELWMNELTKK